MTRIENQLNKYQYMCAFACIACRKAFKRPITPPYDKNDFIKECPHCKSHSYNVGRKFRTPKISDDKGWKLVEFLIQNGFLFHNVYIQDEKPVLVKVPYPQTLQEAQEFVKKYKNQSIYIEE
jgi:hypothetical protein